MEWDNGIKDRDNVSPRGPERSNILYVAGCSFAADDDLRVAGDEVKSIS
jgi:hypothetical protein